MKRIVIDIYGESDGHLNGLVEIKSEEYNFLYVNNVTGHGLQCSYEGSTDKYKALGFRLARMSDLVRKIELSEGDER